MFMLYTDFYLQTKHQNRSPASIRNVFQNNILNQKPTFNNQKHIERVYIIMIMSFKPAIRILMFLNCSKYTLKRLLSHQAWDISTLCSRNHLLYSYPDKNKYSICLYQVKLG